MSNGLEILAEVVAPSILIDAIDTSRMLTSLGIPHALIGGLAVGIHGHPRATKDVDFLVGEQAFSQTEPILVYRSELAEVVRMGEIDLLGIPPGQDELKGFLAIPEGNQVPVIPVEALIYLKLSAGRPQDKADVHALLKKGIDTMELKRYLTKYAPSLVSKLAELVE